MRSRSIRVLLAMMLMSWCAFHADGESYIARGKRAPWLPDLVDHPYPDYSYEARSRRWEGEGIFHVTLDFNTGLPTDVRTTRSTGFKMLDEAAIAALRQWGLRPRKWKEIDVPVRFTMHPRPRPGYRAGVPLDRGMNAR